MTPEVEAAIAEIKQAFAEHQVDVDPEEQGGAYIVVHDLFIGERYTPSQAWVGFTINFQYPHSDVYPHFIEPSVRRADGAGFGQGISGPTDWHNRKAIQISRRSNHWNPAYDTAAIKLAKVLEWLRQQ
ncbi:MAG: E2/UBC family protein [Bellilinea sp.]